ncbi:MAG TPA: DUF2007 domain-containing protein [Thermoanaerobaculia bacterium]|nr:DUF2007 domain-containing protein [Thermoanaerobaculia bacterium]
MTVATYSSPWEAELARARLESEGIDSIVADAHLSRLYCSNIVGGVKVQVREDEAARAGDLLRELRPIPEIYLVTEEDAGQPRCPGCNSDNITFERWSRLGFVSSWLLLGFPLPVPRNRWLCNLCGADWKDEDAQPGPGEEDEEESMTELITVARFTTPWEAHLARMRLEAEGIEACVFEERLPPVNLLTGEALALNRLAVNEADAERALAVLDSIAPLQDLDETAAE